MARLEIPLENAEYGHITPNLSSSPLQMRHLRVLPERYPTFWESPCMMLSSAIGSSPPRTSGVVLHPVQGDTYSGGREWGLAAKRGD